ncbi:hypothetical protein [Nocardia rhamnosiphila]
MSAERGSAEWSRALAAAQAERERLVQVDDVLSDMFLAAANSQLQKNLRDCSVEIAKLKYSRAAKDSLRAEQDTAEDHVDHLLCGPEYVEQRRRRREEIRARVRVEREGRERTR